MAKVKLVSNRRSNVVQLPSELNRLRSADRLIQEWMTIQDISSDKEKLAALLDWRQQVGQHQVRFS